MMVSKFLLFTGRGLLIMEDTPPYEQHVCRVGISRGDDAVGKLGKTLHSYVFGGSIKFLMLDSLQIGVKSLGLGLEIPLFVLLTLNLGYAKPLDAGPTGLGVVNSPMKQPQWFSVEDGLVPVHKFKPWNSALDDGNAISGPVFTDIGDCKVMMLVGLPALVVVFPKAHELKLRADKRCKEMGREVPADAVKNISVSYALPMSMDMSGSDECFSQLSPELFGGYEHALKADSIPMLGKLLLLHILGVQCKIKELYQRSTIAQPIGMYTGGDGVIPGGRTDSLSEL
ncbi:conserved hypothetical protein [Ricinus communis]|uniref:Uncharacterized protein n=1 Tax=Ricinus communis TaxID=3988 RepID=B9SFB4_RICCO|nr:conserved hypothetical protein [Ricinus communis]